MTPIAAGASRAVGAVLLLALALPPSAAPQSLDLTGYALGVATRAGASDLGDAGSTLLARTRVMPVLTLGSATLDIAYEHILSHTPEDGGLAITTPGGEGARSSDWLGADWDLHTTSRTSWRHRFDRLSLAFDVGPLSLVAGRQPISWATTLFLTPADPFSPFDPSDPFREYRGGVDALRVQAFTGPFSEIEGVVRAAETPDGSTLTALARGQTSRGGWALGGWAGVVHDQGAGALFATGSWGAMALRAEVAAREDPGGGGTVRGALGTDRNFLVSGKDLYVVLEIQYDGFGAATSSALIEVAESRPFAYGEMQVLGRWTGAAQASYQAHPLVSVDALALANLGDGSFLLAPGMWWTATSSASVRLGTYVGVGPSSVEPGERLASEYGIIPWIGYAALSLFF